MKNSLIRLFVAFLAFTACSNHQGKKNIAITGIDSTLRPGDDFFKYVNGKWYDSIPIPASQAGVGVYMFMNYPQRMRLQGILDSISQSKNPAGSIAQKVGDFYASGDTPKPIIEELSTFTSLTTKFIKDGKSLIASILASKGFIGV